jgi:hypothetical protein
MCHDSTGHDMIHRCGAPQGGNAYDEGRVRRRRSSGGGDTGGGGGDDLSGYGGAEG